MMEKKAKKGRKIFYVSGEVDTKDREQIRGIIEKQNDSIIVVFPLELLALVSTLKICIILFLFSPSKSQIKVLQSIGRGLQEN